MGRCKHEHVVTKYDCDGLPDPLELSFDECLDCGEWQPMGPANDGDERVRDELLLAELLAEVPEMWEPRDQELAFENTVDAVVYVVERRTARQISTHPNRDEGDL